MSEERIRKQLVDLDFPNLCRLIVTAEVHPRCIALCHDGKEYAVTIHEKLCNRAKVYYHGSKAVCIGGSGLRVPVARADPVLGRHLCPGTPT